MSLLSLVIGQLGRSDDGPRALLVEFFRHAPEGSRHFAQVADQLVDLRHGLVAEGANARLRLRTGIVESVDAARSRLAALAQVGPPRAALTLHHGVGGGGQLADLPRGDNT